MNNYHQKGLLDNTYDFNKNYFIKHLPENEWKQVHEIIENHFRDGSEDGARSALKKFTKLRKGQHNIDKLRKVVDTIAESYKSSEEFFARYKAINDAIAEEFMMARPSILECHFFPNQDNEDIVINMLRTCKDTIDIAIFTLTNNKIYAAIHELWNDGVDVRVITDDECVKQIGSDINRLAAEGIPIKTDDSAKYHMHHKFAIIDKQVVVTGSFNWTTQAVLNNQENILFLQNEEIAKQYTEEFEKLWSQFIFISKDEAIKEVNKERQNRRGHFHN